MSVSTRMRVISWGTVLTLATVAGWTVGVASRESVQPRTRPAAALPSRTFRLAHPDSPRVDTAFPSGRWITRVKAASAGEFPALMEEMTRLYPGEQGLHDDAVSFFFGHWLARDAEAALVRARQDKLHQRLAMEVLAQAWPEKAAEILFGPGGEDLPEDVRDGAMSELASTHPDFYLRKDPQGKTSAWRDAAWELVKTDPAAVAAAWTLRGGVQETGEASLLFELLSRWSAVDAAAAGRWSVTFAGGKDRRMAAHAWLSGLARVDPRAALAAMRDRMEGASAGDPGWFTGGPEMGNVMDARLEIAGRLARLDFQEAMEASRSVALCFPERGPGPDEPEAETLASVWKSMAEARLSRLTQEPRAFLAELESLSAIMSRYPGGQEAWREIVESHAPACLAGWTAAECLEEVRKRAAAGGSLDDPVFRQMILRAGNEVPESVTGLLPDLPARVSDALTAALVEALPVEAAERKRELLSLLHPDGWTADLVESLQDEPGNYAPLLTGLPRGSAPGIVGSFAAGWAKQDPAAAGVWAASLPEPAEAVSAVARIWAGQDAGEAAGWVASLPPGRGSAEAVRIVTEVARRQGVNLGESLP